jgi:hypothetical protein
MLTSIDDVTAAKVDRDRKVHGAGYLRVLADGSVEHVPLECIGPRVSEALKRRAEAVEAMERFRLNARGGK